MAVGFSSAASTARLPATSTSTTAYRFFDGPGRQGAGRRRLLDFMTNMASYFGGPPVVIWRKICCVRLLRNWATKCEPLLQGGHSFRPASDRSLLLNTAAAQIASPDNNDADNEEEEEDGNESDCRDSIS